MKLQNGVHVFEPGETPTLPPGLSSESELKSSFGFKIATGPHGPRWEVATEEDLRRSEGKRLDMDLAKVDIRGGCDQIGPTQCSQQDGFCWASKCKLLFNPDTQHYYCRCS